MREWARLVTAALGILINWAESSLDCPTMCSCAQVEGRLDADCRSRNLTAVPEGIPTNSMALRLDHNLFPHLAEPGLFAAHGLTSLVRLSLSSCRVVSIGPDVFEDLDILESLDLSHNLITDFHEEDSLVARLSKLTKVDVSYNRLQEVTSRLFQGAALLEEINLSHNHIRFVYQDAFTKLFRLRRVFLDHNRLFRIEKRIFHRLPSLELVSLGGNRWICDCMMREFFVWQRELYLSEPPECAEPALLRGRSWERLDADEFACPPAVLSAFLELPQRVVRERTDVFLKCPVVGDPQPTAFWTLKPSNGSGGPGERLTTQVHGGRYSFSAKPIQLKPGAWDYILKIEKILPSEAGTYVCSVSNKAGMAMEIFTVAMREEDPEDVPKSSVAEDLSGVFTSMSQDAYLWLVLIVLASLVVVVLICFVAIRRYRKERRSGRKEIRGGSYMTGSSYGYEVVGNAGFSVPAEKTTGLFANEETERDTPTPRALTGRYEAPAVGLGQDDSGYLDEGHLGSSSPFLAPYKAPLALGERDADMKMPLRETAL